MRAEFAIGFVSGLRTFTAPAIISHAASHSRGTFGFEGSPLRFLASRKSANIFALLAAGEIIADKLPHTPARTAPGPLTARILSGSLCGAALSSAKRRRAFGGCVVGALGAVIGACAGYQLRKRITHSKIAKVPDLPVALIENAIALGGAYCVLRSLSAKDQQLLAP
ncbi:MAG: hypothetical protein ABI383_02440 [Acidobacteriaceae bacterium]